MHYGSRALHFGAVTPTLSVCCRLVLMLRRALDVKGQGSNMYMSYSVDLTSSCQRQGGRGAHLQASGKAAWAAVDEAYTWNAHIAKPLLGA